jgi:phosphoglycolate phosphatase-like HAD superfamily hydrolase
MFGTTASVHLSPSRLSKISHVVFDFDGTLSWLRHGWPDLMLNIFRERLSPLPNETAEEVNNLLHDIVLGMNGKPTILQMIRFAEVVADRGGPQLDPEVLRAAYQERLDGEITARVQRIRSGEASPDEFVVFGARTFLRQLQQAGLSVAILSSTVEERVKEEAEILQLSHFFGRHIYGGTGDPTKFSKREVFERLLRTDGVNGENLLSFGDGPVEIAETKDLGGVAIAVCSNEDANGSGVMDSFKHKQLVKAGADLAVADFRDMGTILSPLLRR